MNKSLHYTTEAELIEACKKGDRAAQKELYEKYSPLMYPVCVRYVGREVAKDVLQDGFIRLFEKIGTYKGEGSFEGWMRRLFVNASLMELRRFSAFKNSSEIEDSPAVEMESGFVSAISEIGAKELMALIEQMPVGFRSVFNLAAIEGYTHAEIAQMLGIGEASSRSQLSRARVWLQDKIKRMYNR